MKYYSDHVEDKEFQVIPHKNLDVKDSLIWEAVLLIFNFLDSKSFDHLVTMRLSKNDWDHLISFLIKTKDKKCLLPDTDAYHEFIIDKNEIKYFSIKIDQWFTEALHSSPKSQKDKKWQIARKQKEYKEVELKLLTRSMNLIHGKVEVSISREKFTRFRTFAFKANEHLFKSKVKNK